jgi:hypothetical protein
MSFITTRGDIFAGRYLRTLLTCADWRDRKIVGIVGTTWQGEFVFEVRWLPGEEPRLDQYSSMKPLHGCCSSARSPHDHAVAYLNHARDVVVADIDIPGGRPDGWSDLRPHEIGSPIAIA